MKFKDFFLEAIENKLSPEEEKFKDSLDNYINDNYSSEDEEIISNFEGQYKVHHDFPSGRFLWRGLFRNNISKEELDRIIKSGKIEDEGFSFTNYIKEAQAFALGTNIFEYSGEPEKELKTLEDDQAGFLCGYRCEKDEIIADINFLTTNNPNYKDLTVIEGDEWILKKKKRLLNIVYVYTNKGRIEI
jgi:hypothetical protein